MGASASKIKFRESLTSLTTRDVSPNDTEFWDELWKIPSSSEEVFELLTPANARLLRDDRFDNLATLFTQATAQLCQIVETPYTIYFDQALNCVRILTRIIPFLLEKRDLGENHSNNVELLCWGREAYDDDEEEDDDGDKTLGTTSSSQNIVKKQGEEKENVKDGPSTEAEVSPTLPAKKNGDKVNGDNMFDGLSDSACEKEEETAGNNNDDDDDYVGEGAGVGDDDNEPLALLVVHAAMHMLFLPQFTCEFYEENEDDADSLSDSSSDGEDNKNTDEHYNNKDLHDQVEAEFGRHRRIKKGIRLIPRPLGIVWAPGVGFTADGRCHVGINIAAAAEVDKKKTFQAPVKLNPEAAYTRKYDKNRIEVLRLLLAACSDPLFSPADEYNPMASRWMAVATAADSPNAPCLFYSLLNTVISYDPRRTSIQFSDTHIQLVELSAQVLCVLLDCGLTGNPIPYENKRGEPVVELSEGNKVGFNIFRVLLARINNGMDLNTMYRGFVRLLKNKYESKTTLLPTSHARLECHQELLILLWKTLEENPLFLDFILTRCDVCELVVPICYLMYVSRKDSAYVGLIHICTFILMKLSGERSFGVSLNRPFRTKLPCDLPLFSGSHADLVSITLHKIIVNGSCRLLPLYSCFLTIVCNFSPYWRSMSLVASVKLVNLFELFSSPKFLYSSERAYKHLALLLEIINNIIQYQYNGNQHLVYAIVRRKDSFGKLVGLTLPKAISQCNKAFPESEKQFDADTEERVNQVAAITMQHFDELGKPVKTNERDGPTNALPAAAGRFVPSEEWIVELRSALSLETVNRLLQHLVPVVDDMCQRKNGVVDEIEILEVFKDITMVGLLPVPHAIVIRKYQPNQYTSIWFTAFMWGLIFLRSQKPAIFDGECIELFAVQSEE